MALRSHAMLVKLLGADHARLIYVDNMLGLAQAHAGHVSEALATLDATVKKVRATLKPDAPMLGSVLGSLGTARYFAQDYDGALVALGESRRILADSKQAMRGRVTLRLGMVQLALHQPDALATLDASRRELAESGGGAGYGACARAAYGVALARAGDAAGGEKEARAAREDVRTGKDAGSARSGEIDLMLADVLQRPEQAQEALGLRREALGIYRQILGPDHPRTRALAAALGPTVGA
jgi:serine/threonine-protein kinase